VKVNLIQQVPYRYLPEDFEKKYESVVTRPCALAEP